MESRRRLGVEGESRMNQRWRKKKRWKKRNSRVHPEQNQRQNQEDGTKVCTHAHQSWRTTHRNWKMAMACTHDENNNYIKCLLRVPWRSKSMAKLCEIVTVWKWEQKMGWNDLYHPDTCMSIWMWLCNAFHSIWFSPSTLDWFVIMWIIPQYLHHTKRFLCINMTNLSP